MSLKLYKVYRFNEGYSNGFRSIIVDIPFNWRFEYDFFLGPMFITASKMERCISEGNLAFAFHAFDGPVPGAVKIKIGFLEGNTTSSFDRMMIAVDENLPYHWGRIITFYAYPNSQGGIFQPCYYRVESERSLSRLFFSDRWMQISQSPMSSDENAFYVPMTLTPDEADGVMVDPLVAVSRSWFSVPVALAITSDKEKPQKENNFSNIDEANLPDSNITEATGDYLVMAMALVAYWDFDYLLAGRRQSTLLQLSEFAKDTMSRSYEWCKSHLSATSLRDLAEHATIDIQGKISNYNYYNTQIQIGVGRSRHNYSMVEIPFDDNANVGRRMIRNAFLTSMRRRQKCRIVWDNVEKRWRLVCYRGKFEDIRNRDYYTDTGK